jgi:hypothetical protein
VPVNHSQNTLPAAAVEEIPSQPVAIIPRAPSINVLTLREFSKQPDEAIDVDAFEYEDILKQPKMSVAACEGYTIIFPDGKSPNTTYPFALHDTIILPWEYTLKNGMMKLFARSCHGSSEGSGTACQPCRHLIKNEALGNILRRMEDGAHENAVFAYHGISGLQEMLHRKNQLIEFY